jgi:spore coat polysaccharide biosynthesis predicted glycosyltransferase SpsG
MTTTLVGMATRQAHPPESGGPAVLLVTAAAREDGRGHISRQLSLAEALAARGARVSLDLRRGTLTDAQAERLRRLRVALGAPDAHEGPVVVDLPDPNSVPPPRDVERLVVFDDRDWFRGEAGLVIQPSLPQWSGTGRAGRILAGYGYAPISSAVRSCVGVPEARPAAPTVVVCFGGSDPADVTGRIAPVVRERLGGAVQVVVGPDYRGTCDERAGLLVLRDPPDLYRRLARATVVVTGGGTMKLELACLGRAMIILAVVDDQLPVAPPFAATGAASFLGDGRTIDPGIVADAAVALLDDAPARTAMAEAGRAAVDGRGAERVAAAILDLGSGEIGDARER